MIEHLRHGEIDKAWWDRQLLQCANRMWYAQSWVLDLTAPGWDALVDRSSGAIMPLTHRRKFFLKYLFQPYGTQQLGVFAPRYSKALGEAFIEAIPAIFKYCDIALNEAMQDLKVDHVELIPLDQQVLPLDRSYEELAAGYSKGARRNLRKAQDGPPVIDDVTPAEFRSLFARTTAKRFNSGRRSDHDTMEKVIEKAIAIGQGRIIGLRDRGELCAAACFMEWEGRAIFYKSAADRIGQGHMGMFRLTDHYIREFAGTGLLLDFAGSNTDSVARFNAGFGAERRVYLRLKYDRLPWRIER